MNDLPVGRSVEETIRLVKAFQFTVSFRFVIDFLNCLFCAAGRLLLVGVRRRRRRRVESILHCVARFLKGDLRQHKRSNERTIILPLSRLGFYLLSPSNQK